jgi:DNA-binding XRE family transcriptional regulator
MSKIQIIRDNKNKPAFAVVPWKDFVELAGEDAAEHTTLVEIGEAARREEGFPLEVVERILAGESRVKVFREWRKLTQRELAQHSGLAMLSISQIETGHRKLGAGAARKLAPALGVDLDTLLDR